MPPHVPVPSVVLLEGTEDAEREREGFIRAAMAKQHSRAQAEFIYDSVYRLIKDLVVKEMSSKKYPKV